MAKLFQKKKEIINEPLYKAYTWNHITTNFNIVAFVRIISLDKYLVQLSHNDARVLFFFNCFLKN
jgi:hypothetical protein